MCTTAVLEHPLLQTNLFGIIKLQSQYLPYALLALTFVQAGPHEAMVRIKATTSVQQQLTSLVSRYRSCECIYLAATPRDDARTRWSQLPCYACMDAQTFWARWLSGTDGANSCPGRHNETVRTSFQTQQSNLRQLCKLEHHHEDVEYSGLEHS